MIKKLLISVSAFGLLANVALADSTNVGINLSYGRLDASGTEQTNSGGGSLPHLDGPSSGGSVVSSGSGDAKFPFGSIFLEREVSLKNFNVALGLDYVPISAEVDKLTGGNGTDATVKVKNIKNIYIQPSKTLDNGVSLFARVGYLHGEVNVTDITRQATSAGTASTDSSANKTLKGPAFGLGAEKKLDNGLFVRASYNRTSIDKIEYINSNGKKLTADADLDTLSISIGKKF